MSKRDADAGGNNGPCSVGRLPKETRPSCLTRSRAFAKTNRHFDERTTVTVAETVAFSLWHVYQRAGPAFLFIIIISKQHFGFPGRLLTAHARLGDELHLTSQRTPDEPPPKCGPLGRISPILTSHSVRAPPPASYRYLRGPCGRAEDKHI